MNTFQARKTETNLATNTQVVTSDTIKSIFKICKQKFQ